MKILFIVLILFSISTTGICMTHENFWSEPGFPVVGTMIGATMTFMGIFPRSYDHEFTEESMPNILDIPHSSNVYSNTSGSFIIHKKWHCTPLALAGIVIMVFANVR